MSILKENKRYFFYLSGIFILFLLCVILANTWTNNPYFFQKALTPISDLFTGSKTIVVNTAKKQILVLNTDEGEIKILLRTPNALYNVNNLYKLANGDGFDNSSMQFDTQKNVINLTSIELNENVFDEINLETLDLNYIQVQTLKEEGYVSDKTVTSIKFDEFNLGVYIDSSNHNGHKYKFFITTNLSENDDLDGYNTNIGYVVEGKTILESILTNKAPIKINGAKVEEL